MDLKTALFSIARNITDGDLDEINKLDAKATAQVTTWHTEMGGLKGLYAKLHKGWLFQLILVFAVPFITTWFLAKKQEIMNKSLSLGKGIDFEDEGEEYDDEDEREYYEELKAKYGA